MALLQWRRFNFFDKELARKSDTLVDQLKGVDISSYTSGRGHIIVGDDKGSIYLLSRDMELVSFKAYTHSVTHLYQLKQNNILVSIGVDDASVGLLLKVWNMDKIDVTSGIPACTRVARAVPSNKTTMVTCLAVAENLSFMAVGFENGCIVLFRGDVLRERHSKQRVVYEGNQKVTGLVFKIQSNTQVLFACTEGEVICITLLAKDKDQKAVLDFHGCPLNCSVLSSVVNQDSQFVIARTDAVYFYQPECRGTCLVFEGVKLQVHWYRGFLVIVGREAKSLPRTGVEGQGLEMNTVTVYDIQNKLIAFSSPIPQVIGMFSEWGSLYVLAGDHKLYQLIEKDTQTKLELLFKKNLYRLAIDLAVSQQYDQNGIVDIYRQYGDHLYSKGDHDGAISQYIKTIGKLEPSYIIRKFLDAQRIHNLTAYLQALHKAHLATEDHTTLLLNCYTKLKDSTKLNEFFQRKDREVYFDVDTAINVCRSAGYFDHAIALAEEHGHHEAYLKIQLEDIGDYERAMDYISKLNFEEAESNLKKYGELLMSEVPEQTTELLKRLCTDYHSTNDSKETGQKANAEEFIHIFVNNSAELTEFLEHMVTVEPESSKYNSLLELYLQDHDKEQDISVKIQKQKKSLDLLQNPDADYDLDQALFQCQLNNLQSGILYVYEKAKKYKEILRCHMNNNDYAQVIDTCKKYESHDSDLWIQALAYFSRKEENCKPQIVEVLNNIDKNNLLPPLLVVQTLAHNSTASLSIVKDYVTRRLQAEKDQTDEDSRLIRQYREDTSRMNEEIEQLRTGAKVFQNQKCSICDHGLELPSVHFLCQHSFHQHCFDSYSDVPEECPVCVTENRKLLETLRTQEQSKDLHDQFQNQLQRGPDGFSVIAEYYGRGVFSKSVTPDYAASPTRGPVSSAVAPPPPPPAEPAKQRRGAFP